MGAAASTTDARWTGQPRPRKGASTAACELRFVITACGAWRGAHRVGRSWLHGHGHGLPQSAEGPVARRVGRPHAEGVLAPYAASQRVRRAFEGGEALRCCLSPKAQGHPKLLRRNPPGQKLRARRRCARAPRLSVVTSATRLVPVYTSAHSSLASAVRVSAPTGRENAAWRV